MKKMAIFLLMLSCCLCFTGCGNSEGESGNTGSSNNDSNVDDEEEFSFPYNLEVDEGTIQISNIYLLQEKTEHGYEGIVAIEFDFSDINEDEWYWIDEDFHLTVYGGSSQYSLPLGLSDRKFADIGSDGKKYHFLKIEETREEFSEMTLTMDMRMKINSTDYEFEFSIPCTMCEIVEEFPKNVQNTYDINRWI